MAPGQTEQQGETKQSCWKTETWSDKSLAGGQKRLRGKSANDSVLGPKRLKLEGTFLQSILLLLTPWNPPKPFALGLASR